MSPAAAEAARVPPSQKRKATGTTSARRTTSLPSGSGPLHPSEAIVVSARGPERFGCLTFGYRSAMKRILAVAAIVLAALAFFSVHVGKLTSLRELAVAVGLVALTVIL